MGRDMVAESKKIKTIKKRSQLEEEVQNLVITYVQADFFALEALERVGDGELGWQEEDFPSRFLFNT